MLKVQKSLPVPSYGIGSSAIIEEELILFLLSQRLNEAVAAGDAALITAAVPTISVLFWQIVGVGYGRLIPFGGRQEKPGPPFLLNVFYSVEPRLLLAPPA